jgi:hypothetical protein
MHVHMVGTCTYICPPTAIATTHASISNTSLFQPAAQDVFQQRQWDVMDMSAAAAAATAAAVAAAAAAAGAVNLGVCLTLYM